MAVEEKTCNGLGRPEGSSGAGLITYKRRKRGRSCSDDCQVSNLPLHKKKIRDIIEWEHGVIVNGHTSHWKCNWCGVDGYGGVSRLNNHIAGAYNVQKCYKAPKDVAKIMMKHILAKRRDRWAKKAACNGIDRMKSKFHPEDDLVDKDNVKNDLEIQGRNASQQSKRSANQSEIGCQQPRTAQQSRTTTQPLKIGMAKVSNMPLHNRKIRDIIGWQHGMIVDGNTSHWKCNWCGVDGYGGVTRLNCHIAGAYNVQKCYKAPKDVAKNMMKHILARQRDRWAKIDARHAARNGIDRMKSKFHPEDDLVDKDNVKNDLEIQGRNASQLSKRVTNQSGIACQQPRTAQQSRTTTELLKIGMAKQDMRQADNAGLHSTTCEQDDHARIVSHWRQVLEHLLQFPDVSGGSGIQSCIHDALINGPSRFTSKFMMTDGPWDSTQQKDRYKGHNEVISQSQRLDGSTSDVSKIGTSDVNTNTIKCQNVFLDILCSEKFALLCDLLCANKGKRFFDFSLINSKMKNGDYEKSPGLFDQDIQQIWDRFHKIGQEMVLLASSLSNISRASHQKQVGPDLVNEAGEHKSEETCRAGVEQKNSVESYTMIQVASCESDRSTKPDQTEASGLYKICTCKKCGTKANGNRSLICDGCEAMYHFSCIEPAIKEIPTLSWYCSACHTNKRESSEPALAHILPDSLHQNFAVCDQLEFSETQEDNDSGSRTVMANDSRESLDSIMESDKSPELSRTAMSQLCKLCGACEDEDKRFLICGHVHCPYKFYHIRCLKTSQIASAHQQNKPCWYCPSCLCRACLCDKDDDKIVLCDGCDEAYHTYCMKPPRTSIPKGQWCCVPCNVAMARQGMTRYEQWFLQLRRKNDVWQANEANGPMDLLLSAAEKLSSEEQLVAGKKDK